MRRRTRRREAGFTVLEAAVSMGVLAVSLLSLWGTVVYCSRSNVAAEQKKRAMNAAQAKLEELKAFPFSTLISEFGPSGSTGNKFPVLQLDDDQTVAEGQITFYVNETDTASDSVMGLPMDLNGDGDTLDTDVSTGYQLLPVKVSITWAGALGQQTIELRTILRKED
jgi:Tfp pilus assembly protein PilV